MSEFIQFTMMGGFLLGLAHSFYLYQTLTTQGGVLGWARGLYFGLWALVLWTLLGPYVLTIWVIGALIYVTRSWWRRNEPAEGSRVEIP